MHVGQEQLDKTRDLVSTTEIELKNCRADLQLANRSKTKLMQRLMASKRRLTALETAGADVHAAQRQMDKLKADAERSQIQMEELAGIEQRAEQRNAVRISCWGRNQKIANQSVGRLLSSRLLNSCNECGRLFDENKP